MQGNNTDILFQREIIKYKEQGLGHFCGGKGTVNFVHREKT